MAEDRETPRAVVRREPSALAGTADEALVFLADLAVALYVAYLPANAVQARVRAAAGGLGLEVETFTLESVVLVGRRGRGGAHLLRTEHTPHWNLRGLHELVSLAEEIAAGRRALPDARAELERITAAPPQYPKAAVVLGYGVYGAAVAGRVGGGAMEILVAGLVGLLAGGIYLGTLAHPTLELQKSFFATFFGALSVFLLSVVLPPFDAGRAIFGAISLLVPAIVITLGAVELASETATEAGVVRLVHGLFRFLMMGAGAVSAVNLWGLVGPTPAATAATSLPLAAVAALLVVGGVALVACLDARPRDTPWVVLAVLVSWGTYELTKALLGGHGGPFVTAFVLGVTAALYGRVPGRIQAMVLFPGLIQVVPSSLGTKAVLAALRPGEGAGTASFFDVLVVAVQLVLGILVASALTRRLGAPPSGAS